MASNAPSAPPPEAQLFQLLFGFMATRTATAVASLGVADALKDGPRHYTDLAAAVGADQRALHRALRLLVSLGVFAEPRPGVFALTPVSELLRSDVPGSLRAMAEMITSESHWLPHGRLADVLRTGRSGPQHAFGTDIFTWFQREENKAEWELFNAAMTNFSGMTARAVVEGYDFSRFRRIVDVGGGHGELLRAVLARAPGAAGVLADLPDVVKGADTMGGRIEPVGGSFFEAVPAGGDCYLLKHIIHDWSDDDCRTILGHVAAAMAPEARVILVEMVMPETSEPHPAKFQDINMLAMTEGGCERTERELADLLAASGLALEAVHPLPAPVAVIEAVKA
jgi:hypothetical protein